MKKPKDKDKQHFFVFFFLSDIFFLRLWFNSDSFSLAAHLNPLDNFKNSKFSFCSASGAYLSDSKLYFLITCLRLLVNYICVSSLFKSSSLQVV